MNQKIVVAISVAAIILSLINLATLVLPKSASGNIDLSFSPKPRNLYAANVTYYYSTMQNYAIRYEMYVANPTNEAHLFTFAFALIGLPQPTVGSNATSEFQGFFFNGDSWLNSDNGWVTGQNAYLIRPGETKQIIVGWMRMPYAPKVRISLLDEFEGLVFSEVLDVTKITR